jgi:TetR/AcrR family transcriptional regulator, lmrAB and yxaGH operons repressor
MARPASITEEALIARLARVFSDTGFEGATLAQLSAATGLQKASLYHRFPGGKTQMAEEVLDAAGAWMGEHVLAPLTSGAPPLARIAAIMTPLETFYDGGRKACLLNMLSSPRIEDGPFSPRIAAMLEALITALCDTAIASGIAPGPARIKAERAVMLLQGSLVLARGTGSTAPFRRFLATLSDELLSSEGIPA